MIKIDGWLTEALGGGGRLVLCRGEAGVGKTRLAEEFAVRAADRRVRGFRMLTVTDEGDHGIYARTENRCVDDAVEAFIVDGQLPDADFSCPGMPLPDPTSLSRFDGAEHTGTPIEQVNHYRQATGPLPR